jgi:hypothetical protein
MSSSQDWTKPPPVAERRVAASAGRQGLVIGHCLQEALQSLIVESSAVPNYNSGEEEEDSPANKRQKKIQMDQDVSDRIMQTFGEAVADTPWQSSSQEGSNSAPAALLNGRLDHYNRVGQNWRIVVDDIKIKRRVPLDRNRRKRDRQSLWQVDSQKQTEVAVEGKIQILAYDDV